MGIFKCTFSSTQNKISTKEVSGTFHSTFKVISFFPSLTHRYYTNIEDNPKIFIQQIETK